MALLRRAGKLKWIARLHFWVMFFSFILYLGIGFSLGPEFLYQDIRKKFFVFADDIVVTGVVPGPPAVPVVVATPSCVLFSPRITLDWADDNGTISWDISRDSLPLTTGLTTSQYADTAVTSNTGYTYQVTAYGPMSPGTAISAAVSATAPDCTNIAPVSVTVETLNGKNVSVTRNNISFSKRRPKVTGTTNTAYAIISITVTNPAINAQIIANANGYFEWTPPIGLDTGNHILTVVSTDSGDSSRSATDSLIFRIKSSEDSDSKSSEDSAALPLSGDGLAGDFDFTVTVENTDSELFQEEILLATITPLQGIFPEGAFGQVFLTDMDQQDILRLSETGLLTGLEGLTIEVPMPIYLIPGEYRVRADITLNKEMLSREDSLKIKGLPLLRLGNRTISYSEAASYIGLIFFALLFSFLFTLLLFVREYWLYLHSLRYITGRQLARLGLFGVRKGVIR
jgi:hypothetical protein